MSAEDEDEKGRLATRRRRPIPGQVAPTLSTDARTVGVSVGPTPPWRIAGEHQAIPLEKADLGLVSEWDIEHVKAQLRRKELAPLEPDPVVPRDVTVEQLQMLRDNQQSLKRFYGKRFAAMSHLIRITNPNHYEQHRQNMKVCPALANPERPGYTCGDCRREEKTTELWRMCHSGMALFGAETYPGDEDAKEKQLLIRRGETG